MTTLEQQQQQYLQPQFNLPQQGAQLSVVQPQPQQFSGYEKLPNPFATYLDYSGARLSTSPFEKKEFQSAPPTPENPKGTMQPYYVIPFYYNVGSFSERIVDEFNMEFCELSCPFGLTMKTKEKGPPEYSMMFKIDLNNPEQARFVKTLDILHHDAAVELQKQRGGVAMPQFVAQMATACGFKHPLYYATDQLTGEVIPGRAPNLYVKLFRRGQPPYEDMTIIESLDSDEPVDWDLLKGVALKCIPVVQIKRIYIGQKASIQMEMKRCIITDVDKRNSVAQQLSTINRLRTERPEVVDKVSGQLAKLSSTRQDFLLQKQQSSTPSQVTSDRPEVSGQPTFAGIASRPLGSASNGGPPPLPNIQPPVQQTFQAPPPMNQSSFQVSPPATQPPVQHTLQIPNLPSSVADFTSNAPTREPIQFN